jgi:nitronate monooxygenase
VSGFELRELTRPVIVAPMAGGPSTPELAAAGSNAGGLGFVPGGYLTVEMFAERVAAAQGLTTGPLGVNLFVPGPSAAVPSLIDAYAMSLAEEAERYDVALGKPRFDDDAWTAKLDAVMDLKPEALSFTFGLPAPDEVARLRGTGIYTIATVTTLAEAELAVASGVDALAAQGPAAGGHRGTFDPRWASRPSCRWWRRAG